MADDLSKPRAEQPRVEPEIIPPGEPLRSPRMSEFGDAPFGQRIYVARFGSFGIIMVVLAIVAVTTVILILLLGALLIWIPVVGLIVAAAFLSRFLRSGSRPRR